MTGGSDDRPKKSWKEIDAARDKQRGGGGRRDPSERDRERASKSQAYSAYKSNLDKLFKPGGAQLPEHMRDKLGPQSEDAKQKRALLEALTNTPSEASLRAVVEAGVELPPEPRLLMSLFDVADEALLQVVLRRLLELVEDGKKPSRMLLIQRLEALKHRTDDRETLELAGMLRAALD